MSRNIENHDSVLLLQDCIAGCKMALESMDDIYFFQGENGTHDILRAVVVDLAAQRDGQLLVLQKACEIHLFASR